MKKIKTYTFQESLEEALKDKAFKKAWQENAPYYEMLSSLIDARNRGDITQKELARRLKTKQSVISRFESGKNSNPTFSFLRDFARALGFEVEIKLKTK